MRPTRDGRTANLLVALLLFVRVEVSLRRQTLRQVADGLGVRLSEQARSTARPATLPWWSRRRVEACARVGRRWPVGPEGSCLRESLVLARQLRQLDPEVVLGVRLEDGRVLAHAWVVVAGGSLDPSAADFVQLPVDSR